MVEEPENLVLRMLQEMRERLDQLDVIAASLSRVETRVDELYETSTYALGLSASGHLRQDRLEAQLVTLNDRVARLEEKV